MQNLTKKLVDEITFEVIGAAIEIHKHLGPGLLEKVYEICLEHELSGRGLRLQQQQAVPIQYKGIALNTSLRCDLVVEQCIVIELKAISIMHPVFDAQIMTYMRLLQKPKGILLNFFCHNLFREGQKTFVNELYRSLPDR